MINVLLVDGSDCTRRGLRMRFNLEPDLNVVGEAQDATNAIALAKSLQPDVIVMDIELTDLDGYETTRQLRGSCPNGAVVILTLYGSPAARRMAAEAGACEFIEKDGNCRALVDAVRRAAQVSATDRSADAPGPPRQDGAVASQAQEK